MNSIHPLKKLAQNFRNEEKELSRLGINTWEGILKLGESNISKLIKETLCTNQNLKRLRCIGLLICELDITQEESSILIHSGISSVKALGRLNPEELLKRTGRLERLLRTRRNPIINLKKASSLIKEAKTRRNINRSNKSTIPS